MKREKQKKSFWRELFGWVMAVVVAFAVALFINNFIIVNATIPTGSMETTIMAGDRVIANRLAYLSAKPQRFDVIVFKYPDDETQNFVKRVIGLPGETVEIKDGVVLVDDVVLDDWAYLHEEPKDDYGPFTVPEGHYFMLGDNRNNSRDSRYWNNTYVAEDKILGKVMFQYYPKIRKII